MPLAMIECLEQRQLLSDSVLTAPAATPVPGARSLAVSDVQTILAQAISQGGTRSTANTEVAVVVDREGTVLGMLASSGAVSSGIMADAEFAATARARTAALFESSGEAFTTRTARFIIQNHFPPGVANSSGGPLYGVEFSSLIDSGTLLSSQTPAISGDPGGVPLYMKDANGKPVAVGGIGVAGDFRDVAATAQLVGLTQDSTDNGKYNANPKGLVYHGNEETDRDEAVALAGAQGYMAPASIRANKIFVGGLRLPFAAEGAARGKPVQTYAALVAAGAAGSSIQAGVPEMQNYSFAGTAGLIRDRASVVMSDTPGVPATDAAGNSIPHTDPQNSDNILGATPTADGNYLTLSDVTTVITQAVQEADITRAGIRKPNGTNAEVHVVVVDTAGDVLGAFRMNDGTNFSYDVAVQKARTAAYFSDDSHAFSTRAIGFMAQQDFPPGITKDGTGPLYLLQNALSPNLQMLPGLSSHPYSGLADGITIFPGGVPLYKNGVLVGAIGVSGDGVDQDDLIAYTGAHGYEAPNAIRSDSLSASDTTSFIMSKLVALEQLAGFSFDNQKAQKALQSVLPHTRLPYVKFPRNPGVNGK